jgi:hypothetical protein
MTGPDAECFPGRPAGRSLHIRYPARKHRQPGRDHGPYGPLTPSSPPPAGCACAGRRRPRGARCR